MEEINPWIKELIEKEFENYKIEIENTLKKQHQEVLNLIKEHNLELKRLIKGEPTPPPENTEVEEYIFL